MHIQYDAYIFYPHSPIYTGKLRNKSLLLIYVVENILLVWLKTKLLKYVELFIFLLNKHLAQGNSFLDFLKGRQG